MTDKLKSKYETLITECGNAVLVIDGEHVWASHAVEVLQANLDKLQKQNFALIEERSSYVKTAHENYKRLEDAKTEVQAKLDKAERTLEAIVSRYCPDNHVVLEIKQVLKGIKGE